MANPHILIYPDKRTIFFSMFAIDSSVICYCSENIFILNFIL